MKLVNNVAPIQVMGLWIDQAAFTRDLLDRDDRFTKNLAGIRAAGRIEAALCSEGLHGVLEEQDWKLLREAVEAPTAGYLTLRHQNAAGEFMGPPIQIARALLPFIEAVLKPEQKLKVVPAPEPSQEQEKTSG